MENKREENETKSENTANEVDSNKKSKKIEIQKFLKL